MASHVNNGASSEHIEASTSPAAANQDTAMTQALPASASVPTTPRTSAKTNGSRTAIGKEIPALAQTTPESSDSKVPVSPRETAPDLPSSTVLHMSEDQDTKPLDKRLREEDEPEESSPSKLKKTDENADVKAARSTPAQTEALDKASVAVGDDIATDEGPFSADEIAESKRTARKAKSASKAVLKKKSATPRRKPACAECKRRKVRCTHNLAEDSPTDQGKYTTDPTPDDAVTTTRRSTKVTNAGEKEPVAQDNGANNHEESSAQQPTRKSNPKKKTAAKPSRAPPERTSTRTRKAPERFEKLQEQPAPRTSPPRKGTSRVFDPIYITTNSTSRLGRADIYHMLLEDSAWTSLSAEQQTTLVSMLPDSADNQRLLEKIRSGEEDTRPQWLKASDVFRDEVAKFKNDLTNGHLAKTWQAAAEQAVAERAAGDYDEWKAKEAELWWGQKSK